MKLFKDFVEMYIGILFQVLLYNGLIKLIISSRYEIADFLRSIGLL